MINFLKRHQILIYNLFIVILFIIALYLRLRPALMRPIIFDESFTVVFLAKFNKLIDIINSDPSVPPLQYLLVKVISLVSTNLLWLRSPSIIFSMLSLYLIYKWTIPFSKRVALFTLIFLTFSTFQITFAWQAYVYSQLFFFSLLSIYFFYQSFYEGRDTWQNLAGFFFLSLGSWFTHYGYIWTLAGITAVIFSELWKVKFKFKLLKKPQRKTLYIFISIILCLLAYSPILFSNFNQALKNISWMEKINIYSFGEKIIDFFGLYDQFKSSFLCKNIFYIISTSLFSTLCLYLLFFKKNISKKRRVLTAFLTIILISNLFNPIIFSLIVGQSLFAERSLIISSMLISVLFSFILNDFSRIKNVGLLTTFILISFYVIHSRKIDRNTEEITQHQEAAKYYVGWFRENAENVGKDINLLLFDSLSPYPHTDDLFKNFTSLDYYWYGYNGEKPLKKYNLIRNSNINQYSNETFYVLVMQNSKKIDINKRKDICNNLIKVHEVDNEFGLNIYKCN